MAPLISVITTVYNGAPYLAAAIDGVLGQSIRDFEYLIVDDASTDDTPEILAAYAQRDARIRIVTNERNLGLPGSRNKVLPMAAGTYIAWQDADDISLPTRFERILERMQADPGIGICGASLEFFDGDVVRGYRRYALDDAILRQRIFRYSPVAHPSALILRRCFADVGDFDLSFVPAEDVEFSFRIGTKFKFANVPNVLLRYRQHTSSMTFTRLKAMERGTILAREHYRDNPAYHFSLLDRAYTELHRASVAFVPPRLKIALFDLWRNSRD